MAIFTSLTVLLTGVTEGHTNSAAQIDLDETAAVREIIWTAKANLLQRMRDLDPETLRTIQPQLGQQAWNLETTHRLHILQHAEHESPLHKAVEIAKAGTDWQRRTMEAPMAEPVMLTGYNEPSEALLEIANRYNTTPTRQELLQIHSLDQTPPDLKSALASFLDAFLALDTAARAVYEDPKFAPDELRPNDNVGWKHGYEITMPQESRAQRHAPTLPVLELGHLLATRSQFLDTIIHLRGTLETTGTSKNYSCSPVQLSPAFNIDLDDCDNVYADPFALSFDAGGDDIHYNNAGGNSLDPRGCATIFRSPVAALVDLGQGTDEYGKRVPCGISGGGHAGMGFLLDGGGSDMYRGHSGGITGGGYLGGMGFLLDAGGDDTYRAWEGGTNGGGDLGGVGFLLDLAGNDTYVSGGLGTNGGGWFLGVGFLFDGDGNDLFEADGFGTNGGSALGRGFLFSGGGDDEFRAKRGGTNGGGYDAGSGFLFNAGGNDSYVSGEDGTNGGGVFFGGVGVLLDVRGDDQYTATKCGVNGGSKSNQCPSGPETGLGLLLDGEGIDEYEDDFLGSCIDCSMIPKGEFGAQSDSDDPIPTYISLGFADVGQGGVT